MANIGPELATVRHMKQRHNSTHIKPTQTTTSSIEMQRSAKSQGPDIRKEVSPTVPLHLVAQRGVTRNLRAHGFVLGLRSRIAIVPPKVMSQYPLSPPTTTTQPVTRDLSGLPSTKGEFRALLFKDAKKMTATDYDNLRSSQLVITALYERISDVCNNYMEIHQCPTFVSPHGTDGFRRAHQYFIQIKNDLREYQRIQHHVARSVASLLGVKSLLGRIFHGGGNWNPRSLKTMLGEALSTQLGLKDLGPSSTKTTRQKDQLAKELFPKPTLSRRVPRPKP